MRACNRVHGDAGWPGPAGPSPCPVTPWTVVTGRCDRQQQKRPGLTPRPPLTCIFFGRGRYPVVHVSWEDVYTFAGWRASSSRPRSSGSSPPAVASRARSSRGGTSTSPAGRRWRTPGRASSPGRTCSSTATRSPHRWAASHPTATGCSTSPATFGNGLGLLHDLRCRAARVLRAEQPPRQRPGAVLGSGRRIWRHAATDGHQGRVTPVRPELLPEVPSRPATADGRHRHRTSASAASRDSRRPDQHPSSLAGATQSSGQDRNSERAVPLLPSW